MIEIIKTVYEHPVATCFFLFFLSLCIPNISVRSSRENQLKNLRDRIRQDLKQEKENER